MKFTETPLAGAFVVNIEPLCDDRGFFTRSWCSRELSEHGLNAEIAQCSYSFNKKKGTLRGMHYQVSPCEETKIVSCKAGALFDVIIDLRPESATFKKWFALELSATNHAMLYIPPGFAHGYQTLENNTEVYYQISSFYASQYASGVRWDDPVFAIEWPSDIRTIAERDQHYPDFSE